MSIDFMEALGVAETKSTGAKVKFSSSDVMFPMIEGKVTVKLQVYAGEPITFEFKSHPDLKIVDAYISESDGKFIHALRGQDYDFLISNIFKEVLNDDLRNARVATCIFLSQIQTAFDAGEEYVETNFGWKHLEVAKTSKKDNELPSGDFSKWIHR